MASIMTAIELQDQFSSVLYGVIDTVNMAIGSMYDMSEAMGADIDTSSLQAAQDRIAQTTAALDRMNAVMEEPGGPLPVGQEMEAVYQQINNNIEAQNRFNDTIADCHSKVVQVDSGFKGWEKAIIVANNALGLVKNVLGDAGVMDMSGAFGRIDTMNRFQKTITTMTGDAGLAEAALAKLKDVTVGTAYGLDVASKATQGFVTRGMSLGAATEQVRIWADAVSFYGEGTNEQLESVVDAIGKIYSKGTVEADQLSRLFDAGIGAAEIYANAVGESVSQVQDDLSDGTISAAQFLTVVSQAMDAGVSSGAAKTAGDTWATTFANVGAAINRGWVEIIENLDAALASRGLPSTMEMVQMFGQTVENTLDTVAGYMGMVVDLAVTAGNGIAEAGSFISDNWGIIAPIIIGIATAWLLFNGVLTAYNIIQSISNALAAISAARSAISSGLTLAQAAATTTATGAQVGLNAAMLASPLPWIILLISALVVVIALVCAHIANMGGTAQTAFGVFCGAVNVGLQWFKNFGLSVADVVLAIGNSIKAIAGNIPIAFHNALAKAKSYFYNFEYSVVSIIAAIGDALNKLPFVSFDTSGLWSAANGYAVKAMQAANSTQEYNSISDAWNEGKNTFEVFQDGWVQEAYNKGANWGDGISDKVSDKISGLKDFFNPSDGLPDKDDHQKDYSSILGDSSLNNLGNIAGNTGDIAGNTGSLGDIAGNTGSTAQDTARIADAVDITEDDLKYLRDIAEREIIDRTVFTKVEVNMGGINNEVHNMTDLDAIPDYINNVLVEKMAISAEG